MGGWLDGLSYLGTISYESAPNSANKKEAKQGL